MKTALDQVLADPSNVKEVVSLQTGLQQKAAI